MEQFLRAYVERTEGEDDPTLPVRFTASTEGIKRDGLDLKADGWMLENYRKHPVVLYAHDYMGHNLPIGTGEPVMDGKRLLIDVRFDTEDDFAMKVRRKAVKGMMAGSVGWDNVEIDGKVRYDLLEFSIVPVPADPEALPMRTRAALAAVGKMFEQLIDTDEPDDPEPPPGGLSHRGAIPPHTTEKAPEGAEWNGPGEVSKADGKDQLRRMHAWVDDAQDADLKSAYKMPHHEAESGQVVWAGVRAAMARLFQSSTQIPDEDREAVWRHLSRHYRQFDKEPPEFRSAAELAKLAPDEIRGMFLEGEVMDHEERAGAVLSARNMNDLQNAVELIQGVIERAKKEEPKDDAEAERKIGAEAERVLVALRDILPQGARK